MAFHHNPNITTDGLILYLDAANKKSYPNGGINWYDISGNNRIAYLRGTPISGSQYGGYFETPDQQITTYIELPESVPASLTSGFIYTIDWWCTMKNTTGGVYQMSMVNSGGGNLFIIGKDSTSFQIYATGLSSGTNPTYEINVPLNLTIVSNGIDQRFYKNVVETSIWALNGSGDITQTTGFILDQEQDASKGAFDPSQNTYGWWHIIRFYNKALSATDVKNNFNANRKRFGI
jgi:hypothetical protein